MKFVLILTDILCYYTSNNEVLRKKERKMDYPRNLTEKDIDKMQKQEYNQMKELIEVLKMMKEEPNGEELINIFLHGTTEEFTNKLEINELINRLS